MKIRKCTNKYPEVLRLAPYRSKLSILECEEEPIYVQCLDWIDNDNGEPVL